jgi:hypothetical protein
MRRLIAAYLFTVLTLFAAWQCSTQAGWNSRDSNYNIAIASGGGGCSQYTALAARMDGGQNVSAVQNLICGMVTDGTFAIMDAFYVFAVNSQANAVLSWVSATYNATKSGTCTFTANAGYTGDGSTCFFHTGFTPSTAGGNFTQNSANIGGCDLTSRTSGSNTMLLGTSSTFSSYFVPLFNGSGGAFELNGNSFPSIGNANAQGQWTLSRTSNAGVTVYNNGSSVSAPSDASNGLAAAEMYLLGGNFSGPTDYSTDQVGAEFFGGALTSGQVSSVYTRLHTYFGTVSAPSGC